MHSRGIRRALVALLGGVVATAGLLVPATPSRAASSVSAEILKGQAIYFLRTGDAAQREVVLGSLALKSPWQATLWTDFLNSWETINKSMAMNSSVPKGLPSKGHVFVVLGSALSKSGKMTTKLERRMKLALKALSKYPSSKVLVTGGAARNGHTEGEVMQKWLLARGVAKSRIIVEKKAASTVGNATNSMAVLAASPATSYSLISDSSHLRRASILFRAATVRVQEVSGQPWTIRQLANVAYLDMKTAGRVPLSASSVAYTASNVASVLKIAAPYKAVLAKPPSDPVLTSIALTAPKKVTYTVGERFSTSGMVVKAVYDKGAYARVVTSGATLSGFDSGTVGTSQVRAAYSEGGVTKAATIPYTVVKATGSLSWSFSTKKITRSRTKVTVKATVTAPNGLVPTGKVRYYLDGKLLRSITLDGDASPVRFTYPKIAKPGRHAFVVKYLGSDQLTGARKAVTLSVKA
ncbi:hypothetical protein PROP_01345 [Propionicimonas sp. T2.31MG-18]|uniref:ElyC/SanA/YdcF family protein n=1 Tax=Propionicimonas sp. T2.31MG-18 TaxID=3157620 RepID=UPI0035F05A50